MSLNDPLNAFGMIAPNDFCHFMASAEVLHALFVPFASERMEDFPVSPWVSNARNEESRCLEPAETA